MDDIENQAIVVLPQEVLLSRFLRCKLTPEEKSRGKKERRREGEEGTEIRWTNESQRGDGNAH